MQRFQRRHPSGRCGSVWNPAGGAASWNGSLIPQYEKKAFILPKKLYICSNFCDLKAFLVLHFQTSGSFSYDFRCIYGNVLNPLALQMCKEIFDIFQVKRSAHNFSETFQRVLTFCYLLFIGSALIKWAYWPVFFIPQCKSGQKKYQVNLRSDSAPIQVLLINRDLGSTVPLVFSVPPVNDICPTPPSTPASLQRFPFLSSASNTASLYCSQDPVCSDHQVVLPDHDDVLTPSCSPEDMEMGKSRGWWIEAKNCFWYSSTKALHLVLIDRGRVYVKCPTQNVICA